VNDYAIAALVWLASLVAVGAWQRHDGATAERTEWQQRENEEIKTANATIQRLQTEARESERLHVQAMADIGTHYERKLSDANKQLEADRAAIRAGKLRLYDRPAGVRAGDCPAPEALPTAGRRDGGTEPGLSAEAAEFLLEEAHRADRIVEQLGECQEVIRKDRDAQSGTKSDTKEKAG